MRAPLMNLFSPKQHSVILRTKCNVKAADNYNTLLGALNPEEAVGVTINRQNVKYWRLIYTDYAGSKAKAHKAIKEERKLIPAAPLGKGGLFEPNKLYRAIVVMPDLHAPYHHQDALEFMKAVMKAFKPELVINLGDETDKHAMSFHDSDPNLMSAGDELEASRVVLAKFSKLMPNVLLCDSNHGSMHYRKAKHHGIPVQYLKDYRDILFPNGGGEGWQWAENWRVNTPLGEIMFKHQASGPILVDAAHNQCNLAVGHSHGNFSVEYTAGSKHIYWGAYFGCLIDKDKLAFAYGKHSLRKPVIGCGVILDGRPMLIPMIMNREGRWIGRL